MSESECWVKQKSRPERDCDSSERRYLRNHLMFTTDVSLFLGRKFHSRSSLGPRCCKRIRTKPHPSIHPPTHNNPQLDVTSDVLLASVNNCFMTLKTYQCDVTCDETRSSQNSLIWFSWIICWFMILFAFFGITLLEWRHNRSHIRSGILLNDLKRFNHYVNWILCMNRYAVDRVKLNNTNHGAWWFFFFLEQLSEIEPGFIIISNETLQWMQVRP